MSAFKITSHKREKEDIRTRNYGMSKRLETYPNRASRN
jgi:hypothetical protein